MMNKIEGKVKDLHVSDVADGCIDIVTVAGDII